MLFIGHFDGIAVNDRVLIESNCNLSHGVTIGQKNRGKYSDCPRIGDSVFIGPGTCIISVITVGSDVAIGANAAVIKEVGDNEIVAGDPARKISTTGAEGYIAWILNCHGTQVQVNRETKHE